MMSHVISKIQVFGILLLMISTTGCLVSRAELRQQTEGRNMQTQLEAIQESRASTEARQQEILSQMLSMNGRIEVLENKFEQLEKHKAQEIESDQEKSKAEDVRLKAYAEELEKLGSQVRSLSIAVEQLQKSGSTKSVSAPASGGSFTTAESLFTKKNWKEAILKYEDYRKKYPKGQNVAEATYKIGVCFQELGKKDEAKLFYQEVVDSHKGSRMAKKASYRLKNLK